MQATQQTQQQIEQVHSKILELNGTEFHLRLLQHKEVIQWLFGDTSFLPEQSLKAEKRFFDKLIRDSVAQADFSASYENLENVIFRDYLKLIKYKPEQFVDRYNKVQPSWFIDHRWAYGIITYNYHNEKSEKIDFDCEDLTGNFRKRLNEFEKKVPRVKGFSDAVIKFIALGNEEVFWRKLFEKNEYTKKQLYKIKEHKVNVELFTELLLDWVNDIDQVKIWDVSSNTNSDEERCTALKLDGERCKGKRTADDYPELCQLHTICKKNEMTSIKEDPNVRRVKESSSQLASSEKPKIRCEICDITYKKCKKCNKKNSKNLENFIYRHRDCDKKTTVQVETLDKNEEQEVPAKTINEVDSPTEETPLIEEQPPAYTPRKQVGCFSWLPTFNLYSKK